MIVNKYLLYTPIDRHEIYSLGEWLDLLHKQFDKLSDKNAILFIINSLSLLLVTKKRFEEAKIILQIPIALVDTKVLSNGAETDSVLNLIRLAIRNGNDKKTIVSNVLRYYLGGEHSNINHIYLRKLPQDRIVYVAHTLLAEAMLLGSDDVFNMIDRHLSQIAKTTEKSCLYYEYLARRKIINNEDGDFLFLNYVKPLLAIKPQESGNDEHIGRIVWFLSICKKNRGLDHRYWRGIFSLCELDIENMNVNKWLQQLRSDISRNDRLLKKKYDLDLKEEDSKLYKDEVDAIVSRVIELGEKWLLPDNTLHLSTRANLPCGSITKEML